VRVAICVRRLLIRVFLYLCALFSLADIIVPVATAAYLNLHI